MPVCGAPILVRMIERLRAASTPNKIIVATSTDASDTPVVSLCEQHNVDYFRGSLEDLLDRHYQCATKARADAVVKIPSDCPLIDPSVVDKVIQYFIDHADCYDFVSNLHPATYPDGYDTEIFSMRALSEAWNEATKPHEREHTTPFIWDQPQRYRLGNVTWETGKDVSMSHRWTLDYADDYEFVRAVYEALYEEGKVFSMQAILDLLDEKPELSAINARYVGVNWYRHHLDDLKTVTQAQTKLIDMKVKSQET